MLDFLRLAISTFQQAITIIFNFLTANQFQQLYPPNQHSKTVTMKNIVILGASYAGISTAHRILKQAAKTGPFKITLVSPNTHLYWNMASPRGLLPGKITDDNLFQPIAAGFKEYPATRFQFILASAESLDVQAKKVGIAGSDGTKTLDYDFLILATGSHTKDNTPFKGLGTTEATKDALHDFQARVKKAQMIVVAGGGVTSVEIAGELAFEYGRQKEIILVSRSDAATTFLPEHPDVLTLRRSQAVQQFSRKALQVYQILQ